MSRTPENEKISRDLSQQYKNEQQTTFSGAQKDIGQFNTNVGTLEKGGNVGADPFQNPAYLANQNKLTSYAASGENDAAKTQLEDLNRRTGGQNTGATQADITKLGLGKMRFSDQAQTQRSAADYKSNLGWQQYLAGAPLQAAGAEGSLFGTATSGQNSTGNDLTKYGLNQQAEWSALLQQMIKAGQAVAPVGVNAATGGAGIGGFGEGK